MKVRILLAVIALQLSLVGKMNAQVDKIALIKHALDSFRARYGIPGFTVSIISKNNPVDLAAGYADTATKTLLTPANKLLGGSTGKMFFAISILQLAASDRLHLDDKAVIYLGRNDWYKRVPNADKITIRQLLNHSSGIQEYYMQGDFFKRIAEDPSKNWKVEELLAYVFDLPPLFEPGTSFSYSDTDYLLLAMIIEEVTKEKAYDYIQQNVLDRIKLTNTVPSIVRKIPGLVNGYSSKELPSGLEGAMMKDDELIVNPQFEWGGGGFATSSHDLASLVYELMNGRLLTMSFVREMKQKIPAAELGKNNYYGLGLQIISGSLDTSFGHSGWFPGYQSDVEYFPGYDVSIAVQMNMDYSVKGFLHPRVVVYAIMHKLIDAGLVSRQ